MNTTEFIAAVRQSGQLSSQDPVYTNAAILSEGTQALWDRFAAAVQQCRQGYWLHTATTTTSSTQLFYKIPANTLVQGLEKLELSVDGTNYYELSILTQPQATPFVGVPAGIPTHFTLESDQIRLWPGPADAYTLRFTFYLRPPELMVYENECKVVSLTSSTVVVDTDPAALSIPITTSTGFYIQNYNGSFEVPCFDGVVSSISGSGPYTINVSGSYTGGSRIQVGDYVRPAGYGVFPMLPLELHRPLADYTAAMILLTKGDQQRGAVLSQKADSGINRFVDMAVSRVKAKPYTWRNRNSFLRRNFGW